MGLDSNNECTKIINHYNHHQWFPHSLLCTAWQTFVLDQICRTIISTHKIPKRYAIMILLTIYRRKLFFSKKLCNLSFSFFFSSLALRKQIICLYWSHDSWKEILFSIIKFKITNFTVFLYNCLSNLFISK